MKTLFAGPWVGELGWELFCWQGVLRHAVQSGEYNNVIISGRGINKFLYEDFCTEYIPYAPNDYQPDSFGNRAPLSDYPKPKEDCTYVGPNTCLTHYTPPGIWRPNVGQSFIKYGNTIDTDIDILIHARCTNKVGTGYRDWSIHNFETIVKQFSQYTFACIGLHHAASHINGTKDLRGIELSTLADYMASTKLILGPSSGPMHLASLCGLNHIAWGVENNTSRYNVDWNPHNTPVEYIVSENWNPNINTVISKMENLCQI